MGKGTRRYKGEREALKVDVILGFSVTLRDILD